MSSKDDKNKPETGEGTKTPTVTVAPGPVTTEAAKEMVDQIRARQKDYERKREELTILLGEGFNFTSCKGKKIDVPALKGKPEKKAMMVILELFTKNPQLIKPIMQKANSGDFEPSDLLQMILGSISSAYDSLQHMAAILLNKDVNWVEDHLMVPDMVEVVRPFLTAEVQGIMKMIQGMKGKGGKVMETLKQRGLIPNSG